MDTSSPQSSKGGSSAKGEGNLRKSLGRSNSCGTEWPTKKKRVAELEELSGNDIFSEAFNAGPSKLSLVNALLEKVQEGYSSAYGLRASAEPSSSSPIPHRKEFKEEWSSPLRQKVPEMENFQVEQSTPLNCHQGTSKLMAQESDTFKPKPCLSDYGDFDEEVFNESIVETTETKLELTSTLLQGEYQHILPKVPEKSVSAEFDEATKHVPTHPLKNEDDEFDDMDEDLYAADLEDLVARYDTGPLKAATSSRPATVEVGVKDHGHNTVVQRDPVDESDDEYGNDFDEFDFEEAEATFANHLQQSASSLPSVRTRFS
jgi:hypothetical protein